MGGHRREATWGRISFLPSRERTGSLRHLSEQPLSNTTVREYPHFSMRPESHEDDEVALERFSARIDPVMVGLALLWLPVLVIPLVTQLHGSVALTFDIVD